MEFFTRLKADRLAGGNGHFGAGARIASNSCLARAHVENAEAPQLDAVTRGEGLFQAFKHRVHSGFRFIARQARSFDDVMNNVLFYQRVHLYL